MDTPRRIAAPPEATLTPRGSPVAPARVAGDQLLTFRTQGRWYACDLLWVREILRQPAITPVDRAPPVVRGLIHLRGQILTALDLEHRLGFKSASSGGEAERCIVFKTGPELARLAQPPADSELAGNDIIGVVVDHIGDIIADRGTLLPPPPDTISGLDHACVAGVLPRPEGLITLLNTGAFLSVPSGSAP